MHARPPPKNVNLEIPCEQIFTTRRRMQRRSHMGVHARNVRVQDLVRERLEPSLRLPFVRVQSPQCRVTVYGVCPDHDVRPFRDGDLCDQLAVAPLDGPPHREHNVAPGPGKIVMMYTVFLLVGGVRALTSV